MRVGLTVLAAAVLCLRAHAVVQQIPEGTCSAGGTPSNLQANAKPKDFCMGSTEFGCKVDLMDTSSYPAVITTCGNPSYGGHDYVAGTDPATPNFSVTFSQAGASSETRFYTVTTTTPATITLTKDGLNGGSNTCGYVAGTPGQVPVNNGGNVAGISHAFFCFTATTCTPITTCPNGQVCGTYTGSNGCGGQTTLNCGTCESPLTCTAGVCASGDQPVTPAPTPSPTLMPTPSPTTATSGDPWMYGFLDQHWYITGPNGWYAVMSTPKLQLNLKMQLFGDWRAQSYWTGLTLQHFAEDGSMQQSMMINIKDHTAETVSCEAIGAPSPCIANGGLVMTLNGEPHYAPGEVDLGPGFSVVAANLPNDCKHKTVTYKMSHPEEHRRLSQQDLVNFVQNRELFDAQACSAWIEQQATQPGGVFSAEGENSLLLLKTPSVTVAAEMFKYMDEDFVYYRLDVSQMDLTLSDMQDAEGIIGETIRPKIGTDGKIVMEGDVNKAPTADYMVQTPFGKVFKAMFVSETSST